MNSFAQTMQKILFIIQTFSNFLRKKMYDSKY